MERLERIIKETEFNHFHFKEEGRFSLAFNLNKNDFDWLIKQAKTLNKIEKHLGGIKSERKTKDTKMVLEE